MNTKDTSCNVVFLQRQFDFILQKSLGYESVYIQYVKMMNFVQHTQLTTMIYD